MTFNCAHSRRDTPGTLTLQCSGMLHLSVMDVAPKENRSEALHMFNCASMRRSHAPALRASTIFGFNGALDHRGGTSP